MAQHSPRLVGGIYRVGQVITSGPMLTTSTAYNRNTNEVVGLLVVEIPPAVDTQKAQALLQPLESRRLVISPNVLRVYDWGIEGNRIYIATDAPRGVTLRYVLDHENIDLQRALDLVRQMAEGLSALHSQRIAGIDLRPQLITVNIIEVTDYVQLDDVGLRPLLNALGYVNSQHPDDIGYFDPRYTPPEYIQGGTIGPWSDVYQVGLLLFELVTGRLPFVGRNQAETGVLQATGAVPRIVEYNHNAPASLQDVIDQTLAKNPGERYASAAALLAALEGLRLPPPRPPAAVQGGDVTFYAGGTAASQTIGHTREMPPVEEDVTQRATLLGRPQPAVAPTGPVPVIPAEEGVYAYLYYEQEGEPPQRFPMTGRAVVVGRADPKHHEYPDIDLTPVDPKMIISRKHARIHYEETFFYIEDLKSHNGTRLGELKLVPLKPELLQHGDVVRFGSLPLIFKVPGMPVRAMTKLPEV